MGRIKTKLIKRITTQILKEHGEDFNSDFTDNKETMTKFADFPSKKLKNIISGYATRLTKSKDF